MCQVELDDRTFTLQHHDHYHVEPEQWHRLHNPFTQPCKIVEIQYGDYCGEDDIEHR